MFCSSGSVHVFLLLHLLGLAPAGYLAAPDNGPEGRYTGECSWVPKRVTVVTVFMCLFTFSTPFFFVQLLRVLKEGHHVKRVPMDHSDVSTASDNVSPSIFRC
jgi:hypothetical protein